MKFLPSLALMLSVLLSTQWVNMLTAQVNSSEMRNLTGPLLDRARVQVGDTIPDDLAIHTESGGETTLKAVAGGKFTVLVSGCLTCPIFHRTYPGVEAVYQDYKDKKNLQFYYLYKTLAHPEYNGYIQPVTLEERLAHIVEAKRVLDTSFPWLCDSMDNAVRHTLGLGPNSQLILNPEGTIVHALGWSDGEVLRQELEKRVGTSATLTEAGDLELKRQAPALPAGRSGRQNNNRFNFEEVLIPLSIKAKADNKQPLYVKPRVEVTEGVLRTGRGEMYLGFHLDPIHHVHWNNLAAPLQYELKLPEGAYMTPRKAVAETVEADADAAPREFVIEVTGSKPGSVFDLTFHYFACSDEEGWCVPVTQTYEVALAADPDGGGTMGRSFGRGGGRRNNRSAGPAGQGRTRGQPPGPETLKQLMDFDQDQDGKLSPEELPERMRPRFERMDGNGDGFVDKTELEAMAERLAGTGGQRRPMPPQRPGRENL